jgi:hypothetical protein
LPAVGLVVMTDGDGGFALWKALTRPAVGGGHPLLNWLMRAFYRALR